MAKDFGTWLSDLTDELRESEEPENRVTAILYGPANTEYYIKTCADPAQLIWRDPCLTSTGD